MRPRVLLLEPIHDKAREILEEVIDLTIAEQIEDEENATICWTGLIPIEGTEHIKVICCPCTGIDHIANTYNAKIIHLDDEWKRTEGLKVTSTAEHTWSLLLQLAKKKRMQLFGKTIGIIGMGRIGTMVSKYAESFGMNVLRYDTLNKPICADNLSFEYVLKNSDILTFHIPLEGNKESICGREFELMKKGVLIVNTSRQEIINMNYIERGIISGTIGGYADDFANELSMFHENVIQTPHISGNSWEARELTDIYIAKKLVEYIKGGGGL